MLSVDVDEQIACGLLEPVLSEWNDIVEPLTLLRPGKKEISQEWVAFRSFVRTLLPR